MKMACISLIMTVGLIATTGNAQNWQPSKGGPTDGITTLPLAARADKPEVDYRSFEQVEELLKRWASLYPDITKLGIYGFSTDGRPLYFLKVSDDVSVDDPLEPNLLLDAAIHGNEIITTAVLLALTEELLEGYSKNSRFKNMINGTELYIVPVASPDGFVRRERRVQGLDPNRVFPYPENTNPEPLACVEALIALAEELGFTGTLDFHSSGKLVIYPWSHTYDPIDNAKDVQMFQQLVDSMAEFNQYRTGQISHHVFSLAPGSGPDFFYWQLGATAIAVELSLNKAPDRSQIPVVVNESREMTFRFIESFL